MSRRFHGPVYFQNGFGSNFESLLNSTNRSAKSTDVEMFFLRFDYVLFSFLIFYTSNALIDMLEILFSREKVPQNVSKNKLVRKSSVT